MIGSRVNVRVWLAREPLDMRRGFDRLAEQVRTVLAEDPLSGHLFVFRSKNAQRVKVLFWDDNGYCLYYKRLERGTFQFPAISGRAISIDSQSLMRLLGGLSVK